MKQDVVESQQSAVCLWIHVDVFIITKFLQTMIETSSNVNYVIHYDKNLFCLTKNINLKL